MRPFVEKVNLILKKIGEEEGFTIILDAAAGGIVYVKEGMDLTDKVIAELNKEFAPTPEVVPGSKKVRFWVFKFKEKNAEAREWNDGTTVQRYVRVGLIKSDKFKEAEKGKFRAAIRGVREEKPEEEFTVEEVVNIGRTAEVGIIIIGEVERKGESVTITCKVVDILIGGVVVEESITTQGGEERDIAQSVQQLVAKLLPRLGK
jgi:hypothetical protein